MIRKMVLTFEHVLNEMSTMLYKVALTFEDMSEVFKYDPLNEATEQYS